MIMIKMLNVFYIKGSLQQMTLYTESPKRPSPKMVRINKLSKVAR